MRYHDRFGHLSTIDSATASLLEIERSLTPDEWDLLRNNGWAPGVAGYDSNRLYYLVMGLQRVIIGCGGFLGFSKLPELWERKK